MDKKQKKPSMQSIANELNISKNAVSLALNNKEGVSEETRLKVIEEAKRVGYITNNENSNIIVFIPEYIQNDVYFYNDIYWSIDFYATKNNYNAVMATITKDMEDKNSLPNIYSEMEFTGALIIGVLSNQYVEYIKTLNIPLLSVDNIYYGLNIESITSANTEGSYYITQRIIKKGHRKIGFIGSYKMTSSLYERWCGFQKALYDYHLELNQNFIITDNSPLNSLLADYEEVLNKLKKFKEFPTAFVCAGDRIALATIKALRELGYEIPDQISVVGFDDIELSQYIHPSLTTMHIDRKQMGKLAIENLIKLINKQSITTQVKLSTKYIERDSLIMAKKHN
ncbi:MAG: LacI family DNA-binding transcriptional regulator [Pleomorphochaeta sp.]